MLVLQSFSTHDARVSVDSNAFAGAPSHCMSAVFYNYASPIVTLPPSSTCMLIWTSLTVHLCLSTYLSAWPNVVACRRMLCSWKPQFCLMSWLIQLRFRGHRQHESTLQSLKRLKQGTPLAVSEFWDELDGTFTDDKARMAKS